MVKIFLPQKFAFQSLRIQRPSLKQSIGGQGRAVQHQSHLPRFPVSGFEGLQSSRHQALRRSQGRGEDLHRKSLDHFLPILQHRVREGATSQGPNSEWFVAGSHSTETKGEGLSFGGYPV